MVEFAPGHKALWTYAGDPPIQVTILRRPNVMGWWRENGWMIDRPKRGPFLAKESELQPVSAGEKHGG